MKYELFYLVAGSKEADLETIKLGTKEIVTNEGGIFEEKEVTEKRKLAYKVKHEIYGFYVARRFSMDDPTKIQEITRKLNLDTNILRFVISQADKLPELKTKEERISAASAKLERKIKDPKAIVEPAVVAPVAVTPITSKEKSIEDIDKKLEEILNI